MNTTQHAPDDTQDETYTPDWAGPWVVTVVIADRRYGGPEEGGWYYDTYDPTSPDALELAREHGAGTVHWTLAAANAEAERLEAICAAANAEERRRSKDSVLSRGVYEAYVFDGWPTPLPQGRPGWDED